MPPAGRAVSDRDFPAAPAPIVRKSAPCWSARCAEPPPPLLLTGILQFNAGEYWACHETLEELWRPEPDPVRYLYQGILQVGVGFYHLRRGNYRGAVNKLASGRAYLGPYAPACLRVDVARLLRDAGHVHDRLVEGGPTRVAELVEMDLPCVRLIDLFPSTSSEKVNQDAFGRST